MSEGARWHVPDGEMASFCLQFATLLAADVKLMPAIITSRQQTTNELLSEVLLEVQSELENGLTLAAAMSKQPDVFSPFAIQMVRQGEIEGALPDAFRKLSDHYSGRQSGGQAGPSPVVVQLDARVLVEAIRPFIVTVLIAVGIVGVASAVILIAKDRKLIPEDLSGPTILLVAALTLLLAAVVLHARRRGPAAAPSPQRSPATSATEPQPPTPAGERHGRPTPAEPRQAARSDEDYLGRDPNEPVNLDVD
jgi:hypothetical protein